MSDKNFFYSWKTWALIVIMAVVFKYNDDYQNWLLMTATFVYIFTNLQLFSALLRIFQDKESESDKIENDRKQWKVYLLISTILHFYIYSELEEFSFEIMGYSLAIFIGLNISSRLFREEKTDG